MHNSHVSQHRKHFDVRMGIKPHTLLEHVCEERPSVVISTFQGAVTFSSTSGSLTQIYHTGSPAETNATAAGTTSLLGQNWSPTSSARSIYKHDHSPVITVFQKYSRKEGAWSLEAMNVCVTLDGKDWK